MREICLDTETTGLKPQDGHRVIEIGAVELMDKVPTGREFHVYINPGREVPEEAVNVHGLTTEFLADKPPFAEVARGFLDFIGDAPLVIHNAEFDRGFLNWELDLLGLPMIPKDRCIDTLRLARNRFPGAPASLDALCRRFGIDNTHRDKHGALIDALLLAEVYLELVGGRQRALGLAAEETPAVVPRAASVTRAAARTPRHAPRPSPLPPRLDEDARARHRAFVETLGEGALWRRWLKNDFTRG